MHSKCRVSIRCSSHWTWSVTVLITNPSRHIFIYIIFSHEYRYSYILVNKFISSLYIIQKNYLFKLIHNIVAIYIISIHFINSSFVSNKSPKSSWRILPYIKRFGNCLTVKIYVWIYKSGITKEKSLFNPREFAHENRLK